MPGLFGKHTQTDPEDAPIGGPSTDPCAEDALLRPHSLTQELLDWLLAALEAVLRTPEVHLDSRTHESLVRALKHADRLYPHTLRAYGEQDPPDPPA